MKKVMCSQTVNDLNELIIDELTTVESLVKATMNSCLSRECSSQYYNQKELSSKLSEERNSYISMLGVALEKIKHIQSLNTAIENLIIEESLSKLEFCKKA